MSIWITSYEIINLFGKDHSSYSKWKNNLIREVLSLKLNIKMILNYINCLKMI